MMPDDTTVKELKKKRRGLKAALTRQEKALDLLIDGDRSVAEITDHLKSLQITFDNLVQSHENYTEQIDDDEEFENEEAWLADCQQSFINMRCRAADYVKFAEPSSTVDNPEPTSEASGDGTPNLVPASDDNPTSRNTEPNVPAPPEFPAPNKFLNF